MGLRAFGMHEEEENAYGKRQDKDTVAKNIDFHQRVSKGSAGPGQEPVTITNGSRMVQAKRAGYMEPTASTESTMDVKTIQWYLKALLGNYQFKANYENSKNLHEFWGGENTSLPSWQGVLTYDIAEKQLFGLLCDTLKIEAKDDLATLSCDWIYSDEQQRRIDEDDYTLKEIPDVIPLIGYDFSIEVGGKAPTAIISEFSLEIKNNHNVDGTRGLGSRRPQKKASAQQREIELSLTTTMDKQSFALIVGAEYGKAPTDTELSNINSVYTPSECLLYSTDLKLKIATCEEKKEYIEFYFPNCIVSVDPVETSESDEIEVDLTLVPDGTKTYSDFVDKKARKTDFYAKVVNNQPEITTTVANSSTTSGTSTGSGSKSTG